MTIGELSRLSGVTIRTLRHYDQIGLLPPAGITEAGYRIYDQSCLERLHTIRLLRELEFPLEEIRRLLDAGTDHLQSALDAHRSLLLMRKGHIEYLLHLTDEYRTKGMKLMNFNIFDQHQQADRTQQAQSVWGYTPAWQEYEQKEASRQPGDSARYGQQLMELFARFGKNRPTSPDAPEAQAFVRELQHFISSHFYTCTPPILQGLADMYETDDFRQNIDRAGGDGTAAFVAQAIRCYCSSADA